MKIYKNYKLYVCIAGIILLLINLFLKSMGLYGNEEVIAEFFSYMISVLIGYNIITMDKGNKTTTEIKDDILQTKKEIDSIISQSKSQEKNENEKFDK